MQIYSSVNKLGAKTTAIVEYIQAKGLTLRYPLKNNVTERCITYRLSLYELYESGLINDFSDFPALYSDYQTFLRDNVCKRCQAPKIASILDAVSDPTTIANMATDHKWTLSHYTIYVTVTPEDEFVCFHFNSSMIVDTWERQEYRKAILKSAS